MYVEEFHTTHDMNFSSNLYMRKSPLQKKKISSFASSKNGDQFYLSLIFLLFITKQKLLGVDTEKLAEVLTSTSTTTRGSVIKRRLKDHQAIG